jgi:hypothetical protein
MKLKEVFKLYGDEIQMVQTSDYSFCGLPPGGIYSVRWLKTFYENANEIGEGVVANHSEWEAYDIRDTQLIVDMMVPYEEKPPYKFMTEEKPEEVCISEGNGFKLFFRKLWKRN